MKLMIYVFAFLAIGSLLFSLYFVFAPIFDPFRFEHEGLATHEVANAQAYFNAALILIVIFSISLVCLTRILIASERMNKV